MKKYESIREKVERLGYRETLNPFRFEKKVVSLMLTIYAFILLTLT